MLEWMESEHLDMYGHFNQNHAWFHGHQLSYFRTCNITLLNMQLLFQGSLECNNVMLDKLHKGDPD